MTKALIFQRAGLADAPAIRELTRQAYAKWVAVAGREPKPMTADYHEAVRTHRIDLLYADGILVGLIELVPAADHLLIENVAVAPTSQGSGFGRLLLTHAEDVAATLGYSVVRLYTNKLFAENIRLYRRFGYRIDREEDLGTRTAVHMSNTIQAHSTSKQSPADA